MTITARKRIRRGATIILALALVLCMFAGCSKANDNESTEATTETESELTTETEEDPSYTFYVEAMDDNPEGEYIPTLFGPDGSRWDLPTRCSYETEVIDFTDIKCLVKVNMGEGKTSVYLATVDCEELLCLSGDQRVIALTSASEDNLYWYNTNREVWVCKWTDLEPKPRCFAKNALGVSPHMDETQGAIVAPEKANDGSTGVPILSPYLQ